MRLVGPGGSGRTRLLDVVAEDCADLAPDGVVRLNGHRRSADDLLHDLFHAVFDAPLNRPDRDELLESVREIGAVVVLDDLEFGGAALDELLDATPECAFLFSATPDVADPSADSGVEDVELPGLDRAAGLDLLGHAVGRTLTDEEATWAGDLWFESEGLPLRFVQAGALLRQRDRLRAGTSAVDEFGVFEDVRPDEAPYDPADGDEVPLPSLGEAAAPAPLLASRLSASARATLRFAVALGGEVPHQAHLPALVGDTHADAALGELVSCGLVSPVGARYRLAAGVPAQLEAAGYTDDADTRIREAAQHYAWWTGHPSVTPERVCAESDAILAALTALSPLAADEPGTAVQFARTAAPAFAAGLHWSAWERALRAARRPPASRGMWANRPTSTTSWASTRCAPDSSTGRAPNWRRPSACAAPSPTSAARSRDAGRWPLSPTAPASRSRSRRPRRRRCPRRTSRSRRPRPRGADGLPRPPAPADTGLVVSRAVTAATVPQQTKDGVGGGVKGLAKRNLVAAGAGALLVAVLGTVVTLGATSGNDPASPSENVGVNPSASQGLDDGSLDADPAAGNQGDTGKATSRPSDPGPDGTPGTADDPTPTATGSDEPSDDETRTEEPDEPTKTPSKTPSGPSKSPKPPTEPDPEPSEPEEPTDEPSTSESATETEGPTTQPGEPSTSVTASDTASSAPVETSTTATQSTDQASPDDTETMI